MTHPTDNEHTPPELRHFADDDYGSPLRSCSYCGLILATANEATLIGPCAVRVQDEAEAEADRLADERERISYERDNAGAFGWPAR